MTRGSESFAEINSSQEDSAYQNADEQLVLAVLDALYTFYLTIQFDFKRHYISFSVDEMQ
jgi:hypothetical protein